MAKKGYKHSEETKLKMSITRKGKPLSEVHKLHLRVKKPSLQGRKLSQETREKMSKFQKGRKHSESQCKNRGLALRGRKFSIETIKKMSEAKSGEKSRFWVGGISKDPKYADVWTETLRRSIRERDNYTCRICLRQQGDQAFSVHHIDYDKFNCDPINLVTVCRSCHTKTNFNREDWLDYFK